MTNFEPILEKSIDYLKKEIERLTGYCKKYPEIDQFIKPIISYSDQNAYGKQGNEEAKLGIQIIQHIHISWIVLYS